MRSDGFDGEKMAARVGLIEVSDNLPSGENPSLSNTEQQWLAALQLFSTGESMIEHPDPIVAGLERLRRDEAAAAYSALPESIAELIKAVSEASPIEQRTIGAAALLMVARFALRIGAWNLLGRVLPGALGLVRTAPASRRLSIATGLVAEWGLSTGNFRIASIYARESLFHGSERQRVQGYLGLAYAMATSWERARLQLEGAWAAQNLQTAPWGAAPFGALNLIRLDAARAIAEKSPVNLEAARSRLLRYEKLLKSSASPVPLLHSRLAISLAAEAIEGKAEYPLRELNEQLKQTGRLRDCSLFEKPLSTSVPKWVDQLDTVEVAIPSLQMWKIDFPILELFEERVATKTSTGLPVLLFCI